MNIKNGNNSLMKVDQAIVIGLTGGKDVSLNIQGELALEETLDMLNTSLLELLNTYYNTVKQTNKLPEGEAKKLKKDIYERAVIGFSLIADKFFPEGVKTRFQGLTDEAIMKAQDEILSHK